MENQESPKPIDSISDRDPSKRQKERIVVARSGKVDRVRWEWNIPLLLATLLLGSTGAIVFYFLNEFQSTRIETQLLSLADAARSQGDFRKEAKWLSQLNAVKPESKDAQVRFALAVNEYATSMEEIDVARRLLSRALAALDAEVDQEQIDDVRRRFVQRLLDLGESWASEAERQVLLLNANADEPDALKWLAMSIHAQYTQGVWRARPKNGGDSLVSLQSISTLPVGEVLERAYKKNSGSIELSAALLDAYLDNPKLFDGSPLENQSKLFADKASEIIKSLKQIEEPRAQWVSVLYERKLDRDAAERSLTEMAPRALEKLKSDSESKKNEKEDRENNYWNVQLVLSFAAVLSDGGDYKAAETLFRELIRLDTSKVPEALVEPIYAGAGQVLVEKKERREALQIWREGCARIGKRTGVELWDTCAVYSCEIGNLEEAEKSLLDLKEAIDSSSLYWMTNSRARRSIREAELRKIDAIKWHAEVLGAALDFRKENLKSAISRLKTALTTQLPIPAQIKLQAIQLLAQAYAKNNLWDLSARTLEEALEIDPKDKLLRRQVANAWQRSGASLRAEAQLGFSDDGSFDSALSMLQAGLASQRLMAPAKREPSKLRRLFDQAGARLKLEKEAGAVKNEWMLDLIRLSAFESQDVGTVQSESSVQREEVAENQFWELVKTHAEVAELQSIAALKFQGAGKFEKAELAKNNLELLKENHFQIWFETNLQLAWMKKEMEKAISLIDNALVESKNHSRKSVLEWTSKLYERSGRYAEAIEYIPFNYRERSSNSKEADWKSANEEELLRFGLLYLDTEGSTLSQANEEQSPDRTKLENAIHRLKELEGESGTRWKLLRAKSLSRKFRRTQNLAEIKESEKLHSEIIATRPRWAIALTLGGDIAGAEGNSQEAIDFYRRAIDEGDARVQTVFELVKQLNKLGRYEEAKYEFDRVVGLSRQSGPIEELAINFAQRNGNFDEALEIARVGTEARQEDGDAWLMRCQAALAKATKEPVLAEELMKEAELSLLKTSELKGEKDVNLWRFKIGFASQYKGTSETLKVLDDLNRSSLPEKTRALICSKTYLQLREPERAKSILESSIANLPKDIELSMALADFHRAMGNHQDSVEILDRLLLLEPKREDIRKQLAIVLLNEKPVPWIRIESLIGSKEQGNSESSQYFYLLMLATRGDKKDLESCRPKLLELMKSRETEVADNALRLLNVIEKTRWSQAVLDKEDMIASELIKEIRRHSDSLTKRPKPLAPDIYQYAEFLIRANLLDDVRTLIEKLALVSPENVQIFELKVRLAKQRGQDREIRSILDQWTQASDKKSRVEKCSQAGKVLSQLEIHDEAIRVLEIAYNEDPKELRSYVVALARAGQLQESANACIENFEKEKTPNSIALLADVAVQAVGQMDLSTKVEEFIQQGLKEFPSNAQVHENVGTLRLFQQRFKEALEHYRKSESVVPNSVLTLNNFAMTASEIPGSETEGLAKINKAIGLYGRVPDLLDTLGIVQLQCGMIKEAEATLREAISKSNDPRISLHLIQVLRARKEMGEVANLRDKLNFQELNKMVLTPKERQLMKDLSKEVSVKTNERS